MTRSFPRLRAKMISREDAKARRGFETLRNLRSLREPESFHAEFAEDAEKIELHLRVLASSREADMALRAGAPA